MHEVRFGKMNLQQSEDPSRDYEQFRKEIEISFAYLEKQLQDEGIPYRIGAFPFAATGRARAMDQPIGQVRIIAHERSDKVLGVHIVGPYASELIGEAVVAMEMHATSEDIARIVHAHPTLSEAFKEAALAVDGRALHI